MQGANSDFLWYTEGPSSIGLEGELFKNGATGVRLTFSYRTADYQAERAGVIRRATERVGLKGLIVADLAGEKFRLGRFETSPTIKAKTGSRVRLVLSDQSSPSADNLLLSTRNARFFSLVHKGSIVTIGDGTGSFVVTKASTAEVEGELTTDSTINQLRGLTILGSDFEPRCLTEKDLSDLDHICSSDLYDVVALSFVGSKHDVLRARDVLQRARRSVPVVAKIETRKGLENLRSICQEADMVMAARGDLALSIAWPELPAAVDSISAVATATHTPWILATQIAEGTDRMIMPTRAEICDLAHWRRRGCSGVLLSYETAFGSQPVQSVNCVSVLMKRWSSPRRPNSRKQMGAVR